MSKSVLLFYRKTISPYHSKNQRFFHPTKTTKRSTRTHTSLQHWSRFIGRKINSPGKKNRTSIGWRRVPTRGHFEMDEENDWIENDVLQQSRIGENLTMYASDAHRWYYLSDQKDSEIFVLHNVSTKENRPCKS